MINATLGKKIDQTQKFLADGRRIPVTKIMVSDSPVVAVRTTEKHGYSAIQIGFGERKKANKSILGNIRGANLKTAPRFFREIRADEANLPKIGDLVKASEVFKPGDVVDVKGVSKGKGYAGVVKRHHFKGGPRTHGQSDRERAPGSIGQTTTPGRVYKGKRMAGRMGHNNVTVKNLKVMDVSDNMLLVNGLVPGSKNSLVVIEKVGEDKKFVPLYEEPKEEKQETQEVQSQVEPQVSDVQTDDEKAGETKEAEVKVQEEENQEKVEEKGNDAS